MVAVRSLSRDEAVHEARKSFKKVRALLRLVRPVIPAQHYRQENTACRDAARPLTEVRDAKVLIETLDQLAQHFADRIRGRSFASVREELLRHHRQVRKRVLEDAHAFTTVTTAVKPTANKGEYEVTLGVAKDAKPGDVDGTVKIFTNDQVIPVVSVPVKATVKGAPAKAASSSK